MHDVKIIKKYISTSTQTVWNCMALDIASRVPLLSKVNFRNSPEIYTRETFTLRAEYHFPFPLQSSPFHASNTGCICFTVKPFTNQKTSVLETPMEPRTKAKGESRLEVLEIFILLVYLILT